MVVGKFLLVFFWWCLVVFMWFCGGFISKDFICVAVKGFVAGFGRFTGLLLVLWLFSWFHGSCWCSLLLSQL